VGAGPDVHGWRAQGCLLGGAAGHGGGATRRFCSVACVPLGAVSGALACDSARGGGSSMRAARSFRIYVYALAAAETGASEARDVGCARYHVDECACTSGS